MNRPEGGRAEQWLAVGGTVAFVLLLSLRLWSVDTSITAGAARLPGTAEKVPATTRIRFLALGDINLGRGVGQQILQGDTLYPFARVRDSLAAYDVVFANLESNISDQNGRTEHPASNIIFTAPPAGAWSLKRGGVTVVATANNHALDFGVSARNQTLTYLDSAGVAHAGTGVGGRTLHEPTLLSVKGVRIAFFAVTDIMNMTDRRWKSSVADADTAVLLPALRQIRDSADVVVVSYHGGEEYRPRATERTRSFARDVLRAGADLFLGHHPHVPYGIDLVEGRIAAHSLGNFVFRQPDRYWTRVSFALALSIVKDASGTRCESVRCIPLKADFQPEFIPQGEDARRIRDRVHALSSHDVWEKIVW